MGRPCQSLLNIVDLAGSERRGNPYEEKTIKKTNTKKILIQKSPPSSFRYKESVDG
jgi:hypothetical protein